MCTFSPEIIPTGAVKGLIRNTHVYFSSVDEQLTSFLVLVLLLLLRFCCCCSSFLNCLCNVACRMYVHVNMHNYFVE